MASVDPKLAAGINRSLVDSVLENYERYYRFAYSLVKNEEQVKNILLKTIYFSLRNGRKLKTIPRTTVWFFQLIVKDGMRKMHEYKKYKRDFTSNSQIYAFMETIEPSATNCFKLYYFEGFSVEETGEILRLKQPEVLDRLKKVRLALGIDYNLEEPESRQKMRELIEIYESVPIPDDLEKLVYEAIEKERAEFDHLVSGIKRKRITKPLILVVMLLVFFFGTIYLAQDNEGFRQAVLGMPIVRSLFAPFI